MYVDRKDTEVRKEHEDQSNLMDSRYKFPMLCSSLHTTTIIQLIIFVLYSLSQFPYTHASSLFIPLHTRPFLRDPLGRVCKGMKREDACV